MDSDLDLHNFITPAATLLVTETYLFIGVMLSLHFHALWPSLATRHSVVIFIRQEVVGPPHWDFVGFK